MRFTTIDAVYHEAIKNKNIYFITGDLNHVYEKEFVNNIKERYINGGLAEQNIIGMAAGLALSGKKVIVYSIVPFITMRCFEQIKVDLCYQNLDVIIIGIGGGFAYGKFGNTHCSIEDIGVMRVLPNMKIVCPANPIEAEQLMGQVIKMKGPTYFRIGRGKEPIPQNKYFVDFGKAHINKGGKDISIFTTGTILDEAMLAAAILEKKHISTEVINMHTIKPIDKNIIIDRIKTRKAIFTLEEHNILGGLGGAIAEIVSEESEGKFIFKRFGINDVYLHKIGTDKYLRDAHGISSFKVTKTILKLLSKK